MPPVYWGMTSGELEGEGRCSSLSAVLTARYRPILELTQQVPNTLALFSRFEVVEAQKHGVCAQRCSQLLPINSSTAHCNSSNSTNLTSSCSPTAHGWRILWIELEHGKNMKLSQSQAFLHACAIDQDSSSTQTGH